MEFSFSPFKVHAGLFLTVMLTLPAVPAFGQKIELVSEVSAVSEIKRLPPHPETDERQILLGIDSNNDGVRDDIERYIQLTHASAPASTVQALHALAKTYQAVLTVQTNDSVMAKAVNDRLYRNRDCLVGLEGARAGHELARDLFTQYFNTSARFKAWARQDDLLGGQVFESAQDKLASCDFALTD